MKWLIIATLAAFQGGWTEVGKTGSGNPVFVRAVKSGRDGIVTASVRVAYTKKVGVPGQKDSLSSSRANAMFNCTAKTFAVKESWVFFDERTNKVYQHKVNKVPGYGPTIAGSFGDVALKHFCK